MRKYSQGKMTTDANPKIKAGLQIVRQKRLFHQVSAEVSNHERVSLIMDQANDHKLVGG